MAGSTHERHYPDDFHDSAPQVRHTHCRARQGPDTVTHQAQGPKGRNNCVVSARRAFLDHAHWTPVVGTTGNGCADLSGLGT
jgi:hypothetical protein